MQKKTLSESGFFNLRTITGCAFFFVATLLAYFSLATRPLDASAPAWQGKVDPTVLSATGLAETEFLIYMKQQADLSGSSALTTKEEKGQYVYQQLTTTAASTQGNVKQTLTQLGAPFQSFWISNTLWARGSLAVVQAVAALPEVAAIHPVGKGGVKLPPQANCRFFGGRQCVANGAGSAHSRGARPGQGQSAGSLGHGLPRPGRDCRRRRYGRAIYAQRAPQSVSRLGRDAGKFDSRLQLA